MSPLSINKTQYKYASSGALMIGISTSKMETNVTMTGMTMGICKIKINKK